jgi:hypothetical protein
MRINLEYDEFIIQLLERKGELITKRQRERSKRQILGRMGLAYTLVRTRRQTSRKKIINNINKNNKTTPNIRSERFRPILIPLVHGEMDGQCIIQQRELLVLQMPD